MNAMSRGILRIPHPERPHLRCSIYEKHAMVLGERVPIHEALPPQLLVVRDLCRHLYSADADLGGSDLLSNGDRNRLIRRDTVRSRTTRLSTPGEHRNGQHRGDQRDPKTDSPQRVSNGRKSVDHDSQSR